MSTWVECEDGTWVNLDRVNVISVFTSSSEIRVQLEAEANFVVHSSHDSLDAAEATLNRLLAASGMRCLRRGI